ncbi:Protein of unknown function [Paenibacillus sp. UNC496MF]|uniref:DUF1257 domain-containing protein n=1 Tax=Paenibacillus sp. UNC496MF TaxID=1502753 RepID=UPI0008E65D7C|nr:DUF1257 domain-containing protein [Paenibacillus sp. UNC496MF]SFJ63837.1 Protein of unknown function [Paenibacillus sp. UNC496MF]
MSHFAGYEMKVDNLEYLKKALTEMGYSYKENTTITDWAHQTRQVKLAVVDKNGKLMALGFNEKQTAKGVSYEAVADWFMVPGGQRQFSDTVAQLHDKYRVLDICEENRWNVNAEDIVVNDKGEIEIMATQWS